MAVLKYKNSEGKYVALPIYQTGTVQGDYAPKYTLPTLVDTFLYNYLGNTHILKSITREEIILLVDSVETGIHQVTNYPKDSQIQMYTKNLKLVKQDNSLLIIGDVDKIGKYTVSLFFQYDNDNYSVFDYGNMINIQNGENDCYDYYLASLASDKGIKLTNRGNGSNFLSDSGEYKQIVTVGKIDSNSDGSGEIFNNYSNNVATGSYSHSEGINTKASGYSAHSEGTSTIASGGHSHAEGEGTKAINNWTHAEGFSSIASGEASHAEGSETESSGIKSHAEGQLSKAIGEQSHAEGYQTLAIGNYSHAEGGGAVPVDESFYTKTELEIYDEWVRLYKTPTIYDTGDGFSMAKGKGSHVEGKNNLALGDYSHVEGEKNVDLYGHNHIEGYDNLCESSYCHIEGMYNSTGDAGASCCHIEGSHNIAYQPYEHAEGCFNVSNFGMGTAKDSTIHSVGIGSSSQRKNAHEIMMNGDHYVYGIGGYNGANYSNAKTLQQVLDPITEYKKFVNLNGLSGHMDHKFVFLLFKIDTSVSVKQDFVFSGKIISPGWPDNGVPMIVINVDATLSLSYGSYSCYGNIVWKGFSGSTIRVVECTYNGEKYLALDIFENGELIEAGVYFIGICNQDSIVGTDINYYYVPTDNVENSEINNSIKEV